MSSRNKKEETLFVTEKQDSLSPPDTTSEGEKSTAFGAVTDLISDTAIPAPIRRNQISSRTLSLGWTPSKMLPWM